MGKQAYTRRMAQAAALVAAGVDAQEVAARMKISQSTLSGWMEKEDFREDVRLKTNRRVEALYARALGRVEEILGCEKESTALQAAQILIARKDKLETGDNRITVKVVGDPELGEPGA